MESGSYIFDGKCFYAVRVERRAFYRDSGHTNEIENVFGKRNTVTRGQDNIGNAALVGNEEQGAAGGHAKFCAEGVWHAVQAVVLSILKRSQYQNPQKTEQSDQEYFSWTGSLRYCRHGLAPWHFFACCRPCS